MSILQKSLRVAIPVIDFTPAEIKKGNKGSWRIVYYVLNPISQKLIRKRIRVKNITNKTQRLRYAKRMCAEINSKLERGWNPIIEQEAPRSFAKIKEVFKTYINNMNREVNSGSLRPDTYRSYKSFIKNIEFYIDLTFTKDFYSIHFDRQFVVSFLDYIFYERKNSPRTHNNYLLFLRMFSKYLLQRGYISKNPTEGILSKKSNKKKREVIPAPVRIKIKEYLDINCPNYLTLCFATYYCFIRRTELCKLKVEDVKLEENYIIIKGNIAKNRKTETVTIPNRYNLMLQNHLKQFNNNHFLFSDNNFAPGDKALNPKKISDYWVKMRKQLNFANQYQFYSLKDTGITELLNTGIAAIKVRDQARHHDLKITEGYTDRNKSADDLVQQSNVRF